MTRPMTRKDWLLLFALSVPWGCSFLFFKLLGTALPPVTIALGRVGIAAAALWLLLAAARTRPGLLARHWRGLLLLGLLNNAVPFSLIAWGETRVSSGTASILNATTPVLTVLVLRGLGGSAPFTWNRWAGVALGFAGVVVLAGPDALTGSNVWGNLACLGAALSYACSTPIMARLRHLPPMGVAAGQLLSSTLILLPVAALADRPWALPAPAPGTWAALLGLALLSTALAYAIYFRLVARAGPANAMLVTYMVPVTALVLGNLALHEPITLGALGGAGIILAGLALLDGRWLPRIEDA